MENFSFNLFENSQKLLITFTIIVACIIIFSIINFIKINKVEKFSKNHKIAIVGIMSALTFITSQVKIPFGPTGFLSIEVSFIVIYLVSLVVDIKSAIMTLFITSIIHYIIFGSNIGIPLDQFMFFLGNFIYLLPIYYYRAVIKTENKIMLGFVFLLSTVFITIVMLILNYFITVPIYYELFDVWPYKKGTWPGVFEQDTFLTHIIVVYGTFNIVKWSIVSIITYISMPLINNIENIIQKKY